MGLIDEVGTHGLGTRGLKAANLDLSPMQDHYDIRVLLDGFAARVAAEQVASGKLPKATAVAALRRRGLRHPTGRVESKSAWTMPFTARLNNAPATRL